MKDNESTGSYYTINHVALISGLTDRTLRNYLSMGILQGEKINGLWHFTPEQVESFLRHPKVQPSIQTKNQSIVWEFFSETNKKRSQVCVILDLPGEDPKSTA